MTSIAVHERPLPPVLPSRHPLGHLLRFRTDPLGVFLEARRTCGDVVRLRCGPVHVVCIFHPDDVEQVLVRNAGAYRKGTRGYDKLRLILGQGLVTSEGEHWKRQRRVVNPAFHRRVLQGFAGGMVRAARERAEGWDGEVDVAAEMSAIALRIAGESLFGSGLADETERIGQALTTALTHSNRLVSSPFPWPERLPTLGNRRFYRAIRTLDEVVADIVARRRREETDRADLLGMMLHQMDGRQLRDEIVTLLLAGHETTANALAWTLHLLSLHPGVARRVEAEVDALPDEPGLDDLPRLAFTRQVLFEAMRLYPPVWAVARASVEDDVLGGFHVPAGTFVYMGVHAIHRHPGFWDDPEGFDPDRFAPEQVARRHRSAYLPFSAGQRKCLGDRFAEMEALLVTATLLRRWRLAAISGIPVRPEATITLRPRHGLRMAVSRRW